MSRTVRTDPAGSGEVQTPFFQRQLAGEDGPSFETARHLCELAGEFSAERPWKLLADRDLILLEDPQSGDVCYCSVMGALGEVFSLHIYIGAESYRFYRKVSAGEPVSAGEFFASQHALSVELIPASKATPLDKQLLKAVGYPTQKGVRIPQFRSFRPGYHPWYVTQQEATLLIQCLQAVLALCRGLTGSDADSYWDQEDFYPFLSPLGSDASRRDYAVNLVKASDPPPATLQMPQLDAAEIERVRAKNYAPRGVFEADHFFSSAMVGEKNERKACLRVGLVTDAATEFLFPPELGKPEDCTGDVLVRAILAAVKTGHRLPQEVRVKERDYKVVLEPLAASLGFSIRLAKSIPSTELAKDHLLGMMGEPPPFVG